AWQWRVPPMKRYASPPPPRLAHFSHSSQPRYTRACPPVWLPRRQCPGPLLLRSMPLGKIVSPRQSFAILVPTPNGMYSSFSYEHPRKTLDSASNYAIRYEIGHTLEVGK